MRETTLSEIKQAGDYLILCDNHVAGVKNTVLYGDLVNNSEIKIDVVKLKPQGRGRNAGFGLVRLNWQPDLRAQYRKSTL